MHCCDIARTGQSLPFSLPDEWSPAHVMQRERIDTVPKSNNTQTFADLNKQLKETFNTTETTPANPSNEATEAERKSALATYEEKRLKNYEVC